MSTSNGALPDVLERLRETYRITCQPAVREAIEEIERLRTSISDSVPRSRYDACNADWFAEKKLRLKAEMTLDEAMALIPHAVTTKELLEAAKRVNERLAAIEAESVYARRLQEALGSLQEMLAKQIAVPVPAGEYGDGALACAACGWINDTHADSCPVNCGLAIIEAALGDAPDTERTVDCRDTLRLHWLAETMRLSGDDFGACDWNGTLLKMVLDRFKEWRREPGADVLDAMRRAIDTQVVHEDAHPHSSYKDAKP